MLLVGFGAGHPLLLSIRVVVGLVPLALFEYQTSHYVVYLGAV